METTNMTHIVPKVLVDVKVEADLSGLLPCDYAKTVERQLKDVERTVKDFHDFLRNHRSHDKLRLVVHRIYEDQCAVCHAKWETEKDEKGVWCAHCGAPVDEMNENQNHGII